jgi:hypothetical protein
VNQLLEAALKYAGIGWHVFPIKPGQKTPLTAHGVKDATTDTQKINGWWTKWPDANIAVACGKASGIYVLDVDVTEDGKVDGRETLRSLPTLPQGVRQETPRGGFHAFYHTDDPPANKNSFLPGLDLRGEGYYVLLAPSIHPNGKRYRWAPCRAPWESPTAEYPDFLRPASRPANAACKAPAYVPVSVSGGDTLLRAGLYLAQCDAAVQGQAGHDKLLWACGCMTWGYELTADQAYDILANEYNPRCMPPWDLSTQKDEKDFRRKIAQSIQNPPSKPRGWLLRDDGYVHESIEEIRSDVSAFVAGGWKNVTLTYTDAPSPKDLITEMQGLKTKAAGLKFLTQPTGLYGEICSWINATSLKPQPYLTLGCVLAFLGVLFGRKVKDTLGSRTNLYVMGVGPSSAGKNHAMSKIRELCMAADCTDLLAGSDIASDTAIESRVALKPASLFLLDEIGHLLVGIKSGVSKHQAQVVSSLMQLYSAAPNVYLGREYADAENQRVIVQPCLCIYGVATPSKFTAGLSSSELDDGWLSRCLVFQVAGQPRKRRGVKLDMPPPERIVEAVRLWAKRKIETPGEELKISQFVVGSADNFSEPPPIQIVVLATSDAEKRFIDFDDMADDLSKGDSKLTSSWLKAEENARRIALILACSDSYANPVVTYPLADRACLMVKKIVEDFGCNIVPMISDGRVESDKCNVLSIIKKAGPDGILKRSITRRTRWANVRQRGDILADLMEAGDILCRSSESGHGTVFWTIDNFPGDDVEVHDE